MSYKYILKVALNCNITGGLTDGHSVFVDELRFTGACKFRYCFNIKLTKDLFNENDLILRSFQYFNAKMDAGILD